MRAEPGPIHAQRVLVYGVTGSGKTTLALRLGKITGLPVHLVDELAWEPAWVQVPLEEQTRRIEEICARDRWLLDTAYGQWISGPLARVELIVALDYPRLTSLWRLSRRSIARILDRQPVCNGNVETWKNLFSNDSIILWHFRSFKSKRRRIAAWEAAPGQPAVMRFRRPRDLEEWLRSLDR